MSLPCFVAVMAVGLFSGAQGQLTSSQLSVFRTKGVVVKDNGDSYTFSHSGIPNDHPIGSFPNKDNPNTASEQNHEFEIPKTPTELSEPGCLPMGAIALTVNGVAMYNPFTALGTNAVTNEVFDSCHGHPDPSGTYHYHQIPKCVYQGKEDEFIGVAFDGYPIYGPKTSGGVVLSTADLDECHGQERDGAYEYRITADFPYILGCYKGKTLMEGMGPKEGMEGMGPKEGMEGMGPKEGMEEKEGMGPEEGQEGMEGKEGPGGMNMEWSSCYAKVGCENPAEQVGEVVCDSGAEVKGASVVVMLLVSLVGILM